MVFDSKTNSDLHAKKTERSLQQKSQKASLAFWRGKMREQGEGGNYFFPTLVFESKTIDHNSGRHAKNQGEISKNEVRRPPPFVWKCGHSPLYINLMCNTWMKLVMWPLVMLIGWGRPGVQKSFSRTDFLYEIPSQLKSSGGLIYKFRIHQMNLTP